MSLKSNLKSIIKTQGQMTLNELTDYCRNAGYKLSNGERRLRELMNEGEIKPVYNAKGNAIVGYKLVNKNADFIAWLNEGIEPKKEEKGLWG